MKERRNLVFLIFIGGLFWLISLVMSGFLGFTFFKHAAARAWIQVPAQHLDWQMQQRQTRRGAGQSRLIVRYDYVFQGQSYRGGRLDFSIGSDNFSAARKHRQIEMLRHGPVRAWVNPHAPTESVLDPSLPAQQVAFALVFLLFPCGVGTAFSVQMLLRLIQRLSGRDTDRWFLPLLGVWHGLPGLYPLLFAREDLGWGSGLILVVFALLGLVSGWELLRRGLDANRGRTRLAPLAPVKPRYGSRQAGADAAID